MLWSIRSMPMLFCKWVSLFPHDFGTPLQLDWFVSECAFMYFMLVPLSTTYFWAYNNILGIFIVQYRCIVFVCVCVCIVFIWYLVFLCSFVFIFVVFIISSVFIYWAFICSFLSDSVSLAFFTFTIFVSLLYAYTMNFYRIIKFGPNDTNTHTPRKREKKSLSVNASLQTTTEHHVGTLLLFPLFWSTIPIGYINEKSWAGKKIINMVVVLLLWQYQYILYYILCVCECPFGK